MKRHDSDGTRSAETHSGSGPQQDCQARAESIAQLTSLGSSNIDDVKYFHLGASAEEPTGLGSAEAPEPPSRLGPSDAIPSRCEHKPTTTYFPVSGQWLTFCMLCGDPL